MSISTEADYCVSSFSSCCDQIPDKSGLRTKRFVSLHGPVVLSIMHHGREGMAAGCMVLIVRQLRDEGWYSAAPFLHI